MNADLNCNFREMNENNIISEECNCSAYSLAAVAGGILFLLGIIVYALLV